MSGNARQKRLKTRRVSYFYKVGGSWTSKVLNQNAYTYNVLGQRLTNTITTTNASNALVSRTETYTYDELSRLKTANYGDGEYQTYSFDAMGNRRAKTDNVTGNEQWTYNAANMLNEEESTGDTFASDMNGNLLYDQDQLRYVNNWDSQNRLVWRAYPKGPTDKTTAFTYGADGLRRKMTVYNGYYTEVTTGLTPSSITHFGYDGTNVVREWSEDPSTNIKTIAATYLLGPSGPMYKRPANAADVRWYVYDGLGSVVGEVDVNGLLTCQKTNDVYGISRGIVGTAKSRHGFVGGLGHYSDDETGLIYMRARYYDPAIGRFVSQDPAGNGQNWFTYCSNDLVNNLDETGQRDLPLRNAVIFGIGVALSLAAITMAFYAGVLGGANEAFAKQVGVGTTAIQLACMAVAFFAWSASDLLGGELAFDYGASSTVLALVTLIIGATGEAGKYNYPGVAAVITATVTYSFMTLGFIGATDE